MIKEVKAENTSYLYVTDPMSKELKSYNTILTYNVFEVYNVFLIDRIRMILEHSLDQYSKNYLMLYLYWLESIDLIELDDKVLKGTYTDEDFENAIKCEFHPGEYCSKCKSSWDVFGIDLGRPYLGNKKLLSIKIDKVYKKKANLYCPNCNAPFNDLVVIKILGPAIVSETFNSFV
jgi:hypothetical protein